MKVFIKTKQVKDKNVLYPFMIDEATLLNVDFVSYNPKGQFFIIRKKPFVANIPLDQIEMLKIIKE